MGVEHIKSNLVYSFVTQDHFRILFPPLSSFRVWTVGDITIFQKLIHCFEPGKICWFFIVFIEGFNLSETRAAPRSIVKKKKWLEVIILGCV